jgi:hypothetical protein
MTALLWDQTGEREFETGVDKGVLYIPDGTGAYVAGYAWNGLTTVTESPSGAEVTKKYADNINYISLVSAEEFAGTIEAFTYPNEWAQCDGSATPSAGVAVGQQARHVFGLAYRTKVGNDVEGNDFGYKLHLVYGALASPSEKAYATVNDSPDAIAFSWKFTTTPIDVPGFKPSAILTIDSTKVDADALASLEAELYGGVGTAPHLPAPADVIAFFMGSTTEVIPVAPTYVSGTHTLTIPTTTGVDYFNDATGIIYTAGAHVITVDTVVRAEPQIGYTFPPVTDNTWFFDFV